MKLLSAVSITQTFKMLTFENTQERYTRTHFIMEIIQVTFLFEPLKEFSLKHFLILKFKNLLTKLSCNMIPFIVEFVYKNSSLEIF